MFLSISSINVFNKSIILTTQTYDQSFTGSTKHQTINIIMGSTTKFQFYKPKLMRIKQLKKKQFVSSDCLFNINNFDYTNY